MNRKNLLIIIALFAVFAIFFTGEARAGVGHNVSGFAWSENIGWISFNSSNCDPDNNGVSNGGTGCPASGTAISNYGVNIDASGILSGYAWSENIGWVSFNRSDTGAPPASPDYGTYLAKVDLNNKQVSGWARALANGGGWDGWIKLRGTNYGVWLNDGVRPVEFRDWSWSDMVLGWLSFNCADRGVCGTSNYKVITSFSFNQPPCVSCGLNGGESGGPVIEYQSYCGIFSGQGQIGFRGVYQDADADQEIRFDFKVNDVNNVNDPNPEVDRSFTGLNNPSGTVNAQSVFVKSALEADKIQFNKTYYWWMRVYDNKGSDSGCVAGPSFTTPIHPYPWIDFSWTPLNPNMNEQTSFSDTSTIFSGGNRTNYWTFEDGTPGNSSGQNPLVRFSSFGDKEVSLRVTDSDDYSCTGYKTLTTEIPLPDWKEILPFSKLWDFFTGIPEMAQGFFKKLDLGYFVR